MRSHRTLLATVMLAAALFPVQLRAAGYNIYEQGAAALGMAGASTASVHDASAVFFNPAAMTRLKGTRIYVGGTALQPSTSIAGAGPNPGYGVTDEMVRQTFYPPTLYATHRWSNGWAFGAGLNSPFGLGVEWDPITFSGRYLVTKAELHTLNGSACLAFAPNSQWSLALGGDLMWAKVRLESRRLAPAPGGGGGTVDVAQTALTSDFTPSPGWNAAALFTPQPQWRFGAYYRSKIVVEVDGRADFTQIPTGNAAFDAGVAASLPPDQKGETVLRVPAMWSFGAAWDPTPTWTIEADFNLHEWRVFEDLPIRFLTTPENNTTRIENYSDSWQIRAGAEHRLPAFTYRFGYYFDKAAAPTEAVSPLLPDANRHGVSLGLGWSLGADKRWTLDLYELALFVERRLGAVPDSPGEPEAYRYSGEYKSFVNMAGIGLGYRW
jgi:long-chain fatty acid transport protein